MTKWHIDRGRRQCSTVAMSAPIPYVLFPGTARAALEFYSDVFGGDLELHTYADFGRDDGPGDAIAHGVLSGGPVALYGADAGSDEAAVKTTGLMLSLLGAEEPLTLHEWFDRLAVDGSVIDPLEVKPWGASDGQVTDAYGLTWLFGYESAA